MKKGDIPTSISETQNENFSFELFPNPATNELIINTGKLIIKSVEIYNVMGEKVFSKRLTPYSLPQTAIAISGLKEGIYFVKVKSAENLMTKKLLIAR